ncbi:hypothetical protein KQX54_021393 [Cotesia glomerata]|uniref:Uncharacterized protein n=1 Tax=Cotesia glomerata TaxID=32391 RepID=A0AAV7J9L2_COTGL|nr:hypothetical protein KQX54_021393 [Cotesia glomerata]
MGRRHGMLLASGDARRYCSGYMPALNSYTHSLSSITVCMIGYTRPSVVSLAPELLVDARGGEDEQENKEERE